MYNINIEKTRRFTFITQITIEPFCATIKASSVKSVTCLVVAVLAAWILTVFSVRLDACLNYAKNKKKKSLILMTFNNTPKC